MVSSCVSSSGDSEGLGVINGQGDAWQFRDCKKRALEGMEIVETKSDFKVFRKATTTQDDHLELIFTDEFGEEFTLKVKVDRKRSASPRIVWTGKAILANAVELDSKPVIVAYEVEKNIRNDVIKEVITTKVEVPREYFDEDVTKAFEINKYSSNGDSLTMVLLQASTNSSLDHMITRVCGDGFAKSADAERKPLSEKEFTFEVGL